MIILRLVKKPAIVVKTTVDAGRAFRIAGPAGRSGFCLPISTRALMKAHHQKITAPLSPIPKTINIRNALPCLALPFLSFIFEDLIVLKTRAAWKTYSNIT
jgi:hypothetical protein